MNVRKKEALNLAEKYCLGPNTVLSSAEDNETPTHITYGMELYARPVSIVRLCPAAPLVVDSRLSPSYHHQSSYSSRAVAKF